MLPMRWTFTKFGGESAPEGKSQRPQFTDSAALAARLARSAHGKSLATQPESRRREDFSRSARCADWLSAGARRCGANRFSR